ncbi:bifunctional hydroxymethylpyrimidine kinase/phosphomethylpyrimidine kinase [Paracoccus sp. M683]|uniref:bifunctional hydroxymethylpyrimidine kinase/phosphomethylpyrimidine kinase n=1 Tax=Paracoccus sp. M683 TaxID=2594268 RepID=UPI00117ED21C|nr:bifunctional hydroxymethylpyrimidine kinase/phosphomethylpyrimidine kinase [Paracoccus sp. M683]TRW97228.1 bifunctional hydroxymethylpyrimidine kinase/phosphomethylpyrimidine kinase [Paracoccus sp. M683]
MIANILSIAGSDPSGGAGIQADIKTIAANGGYAMAAITGLTVQNTQGVSGAFLPPAEFIADQVMAIRADIRIDAVKIGMLGNAAITAATARALQGLRGPIVLDPVMVAKGGDRLLEQAAVAALRRDLLPLATVITPNLPEAADLLGQAVATDRHAMLQQTTALLGLGPQAVLLKGGHLPGETCPDLLVTSETQRWFESPRHPTRNTHGTGCTLSSALATWLGRGLPLVSAVDRSKAYVTAAIASADALSVGSQSGHGPLNHFPAQAASL